MVDEPRCDITDLIKSQCAHCLGHTGVDEEVTQHRQRLAESDQHPKWFPAQWPGVCEHCGERFEAGTPIRFEAPQGWRADCCSGGEA